MAEREKESQELEREGDDGLCLNCERERLKAEVERLEAERDEAQAALAQMRAVVKDVLTRMEIAINQAGEHPLVQVEISREVFRGRFYRPLDAALSSSAQTGPDADGDPRSARSGPPSGGGRPAAGEGWTLSADGKVMVRSDVLERARESGQGKSYQDILRELDWAPPEVVRQVAEALDKLLACRYCFDWRIAQDARNALPEVE